ncbi:hypothetical protein FGO68_gene1081 [Halteria grandinella]|uniref:GPI mannosyltransferase 2 n=1 Tax=Halteria grandinella TaxID=5974 RepID=A0A8J8NEN4_HALGN|nr:hypothetical protein FGO68_gene1081 [Halteria grandinella]
MGLLFGTRVFYLLIAAPVSYFFWHRKGGSFNENDNFFDKGVKTLDVFDSTQFKGVIEQNGYQWETNHAFMPLYPYVMAKLKAMTSIEVFAINFIYQFILQFLNAGIIYKLGQKVLLKEDLAFKSAVLYLFNHALVYNLALQTEVTYTFLTLLGLLLAYRKVQPHQTVKSVQCNSLIPANFIWGLNVLTRAQGLLMLGFSGQVMLKKIASNSDRFCKTFKYIFYTVWIVIIYALSYAMVTYWKPYIMHCETKLDRTDAVPQWCFEEMPNVFSYIQRVYWDNRIFGFLHRSPDHILGISFTSSSQRMYSTT